MKSPLHQSVVPNPVSTLESPGELLPPRVSGPTDWGDQRWGCLSLFFKHRRLCDNATSVEKCTFGEMATKCVDHDSSASKGLYILCICNWDHAVLQLAFMYMVECLSPLEKCYKKTSSKK